ncbi:MAG: tryptophan synthase subunit alpha [Candidatus Manganitrophus sp.]|nr:tryptophan synthase subunit alpha [Candidatus Manganitrophus sp.]MDC4222666.1 tryptophan synthase subunit alpha [Candidatus Manganitrophus sp.]WDT71105.1 MAG: tryptophan synthase subunit alpha [Candidatus Manganitrophus sp.]WDT81604.1 MAG: tryptophan synthase subunit alpha [Candidatus Manganitrophus sp.]
MSRIESTIKNITARGEKALIAYVMAGDPTLSETAQIVLEMEKAGADLIELGVPFSDPVADGPTIQKASERALRQGVTLRGVLDLVTLLRRQTKIPLILMTYSNPMYAFGLGAFFKEAKGAGVDGLIVPDLPHEEAKEFLSLAKRHLIDLIFLVAPTTPPERAERIVKDSGGFVYYVSLTGITGAALTEKESIRTRIQKLKSMTDRPVAVGFGISTPEEAKEMGQAADGIIVGSALVKIIETSQNDPAYLSRLSGLVSSLKAAIRS